MSAREQKALLQFIGITLLVSAILYIVYLIVLAVIAVVTWFVAHLFIAGLFVGASVVAFAWWGSHRLSRPASPPAHPLVPLQATAAVSATPVASPPADAEKQEIVSAIRQFRPLQAYRQELGYHAELAGWLRHRFPALAVEIQRGRSRPDIVIGEVAIEVKGPTDTRELQTIADKCSRYARHFGSLVIVLFDLRVSRTLYAEWREGISATYPHVEVIEISSARPAEITTTAIVCEACGANDTVPFEPRAGSRLYCKACYRTQRFGKR